MKNVDPALIDAMQLDAQSWERGDDSHTILTSSGSIYYIDSNGTLTGGTHLTKGRTAELWGAVYRRGGPIRVDHITVGLCIEARTSDGKILVTSPVQSIEPRSPTRQEAIPIPC